MDNRCRATRREFIGLVGAGGAVLVGCNAAPDGGVPNLNDATPNPNDATPDLNDAPPDLDDTPPPPEPTDDLVLRLLNRITFGSTAEELAEITAIGYDAFLERQLDPSSIDDSELDARLAPLTTLFAPINQIIETPDEVVEKELMQGHVLRAVASKRQLFERMVEFWTDHFNIHLKQDTLHLKTVDDREVIRGHALGNFRDMLHASATSPAMLIYLDNAVNRAGSPNENYARELLELHTVGVDGGYTQIDVEELARALTGWSVTRDGDITGEFEFRPDKHDDGAKQIMGLSLPAGGGLSDGQQAIDYLAEHEETSRFLAGKLVRHFISESVPTSVVDRVADAFMESKGDIPSTLRVLLSQDSMALAEPKLKRPFHLVVEAIRRSGTEMTDGGDLRVWLTLLGHLPFHWPDPNGYPDIAEHWAPGLLTRWNFATALAFGEISSAPANPIDLAEASGASTPDQIVDLWDALFFTGTLPKDERAALLEYAEAAADDPARLYNESFALALSTPAFQWH